VKETRVSVTGAAAVKVAGAMGAEEKEDIFVVWWCGGVMCVAWAGKDAVKERGFGGICGQWRCGWAMGQV